MKCNEEAYWDSVEDKTRFFQMHYNGSFPGKIVKSSEGISENLGFTKYQLRPEEQYNIVAYFSFAKPVWTSKEPCGKFLDESSQNSYPYKVRMQKILSLY